jgi:hypothetical protein
MALHTYDPHATGSFTLASAYFIPTKPLTVAEALAVRQQPQAPFKVVHTKI